MTTILLRFILLFLVPVIVGCSPKVISNIPADNFPAIHEYEPFGVMKGDSSSVSDAKYLGTIEIKEKGLTINCDYHTVFEKLKKEARNAGGNLIRIDEHIEPKPMGSTCHQLKASVFHVEDPTPFEEYIYWNEKRKLQISDFAADTVNRPFQAATFSGIEFSIRPASISRKSFSITVRTQFDSFNSYFKRSSADSAILAHEQLHFDISEIYARLFFKELVSKAINSKNFEKEANEIFKKYTSELYKKQDEYDSEVYKNPRAQSKWNAWVNIKLKELDKYKVKHTDNSSEFLNSN